MTLRFDEPLLPAGLVLVAGLLAAALVVYFYRGYRRLFATGYFAALLATKLLAVAAIVLLLLNPILIRRVPDTSAEALVFLIDASGSMDQQDCDDRSRLAVVQAELLEPTSDFQRRVASRYGTVLYYLFGDSGLRRIVPGATFSSLPGQTDIDGAVEEALAGRRTEDRQGALVLVSDGQDNAGGPILSAAEAARRAQLPLHTIGVGDRTPLPDLAVTWADLPRTPTRGRPFAVTARLSRRHGAPRETEVVVSAGARELERRTVRFPEGADTAELEIEHVAFRAGFLPLKVTAASFAGERNTLNNTALAGVKVADPDLFRVLYFTTNLDWEYRYLRLLAENQPNLQLDAAIKLGERAWYRRGVGTPPDDGTPTTTAARDEVAGEAEPTAPAEAATEEPLPEGFPDAERLNEYDCLVIAVDSLATLTEAERLAVAHFVERRGGGLVLTGVGEALPEDLRRLLPFRSLPPKPERMDRESLEVRRSLIFGEAKPGEVEELGERLWVPGGSWLYPVTAEQLKPGAISAANVRGPDWVVLAGQHYGAGKVAYVNLGDSWKWVMASDGGSRLYGLFWGRVVAWVASSSRERLVLRPNGVKLNLGEDARLHLDLLTADYAPARQADIRGVLLGPEGAEQTLNFLPNPRVDGRFEARFVPPAVGGWRLLLTADLPAGESLQETADFLVVPAGDELAPAPLAEEQLQALARLTNGQYWHYRQIDQIDELPMPRRERFQELRSPWLQSGLFLVALLLAVLPEWFLRRRIGLS